VKQLGSGGFAKVYLAHDETLVSKPVVVKILHAVKSDSWYLRKFQQEKEALARIDDPGVVAVLDEGVTPENTPFLVMQYVDGVTLKSLVRDGGLEFPRSAEIFRQIGCALQAAHEKGIFHRDLKPENIMVQSTGNQDRVRLIDFGIAGIKDSVYASLDESTRVAGTLAYMPPEQMQGDVSARSDIYSFGAVVFELLAGKRAVRDPMELLTAPEGGLERKLRELRSDIPDAAVKIVLRALSVNPKDRFERASDMGDRLAEALRPDQQSTIVTPRPQRPDQLEVAHVLFLDLVGYSTLAMEDQRELLKELQDLVRQAPHFVEAEKLKDLIALPTGDGMALVFFGDPTSAAECALEIALAIREHPAIKLRMGLHIGPVYRVNDINKNLNVSGGGINLAQRVMDAGDAGHILVSSGMADVLTQVGRWRGWLTDFGEHEVKHGVGIRFYNLYTGEAGNPAWPSKWGKRPAPKNGVTRRLAFAAIGAVAVALAAGGAYLKMKTPPPPPPPPQVKLELDYFVNVQKFKGGKPVGEAVRYASAAVLPEGYGIAVDVSSSAPGYLYILNDGPLKDGSQSIVVLFPLLGAPSQIGGSQDIRIPTTDWMHLDAATGTEKFYLVWSSQAVPEFEGLKDRKDLLMEGDVVIRDSQQIAALRTKLADYQVKDAQIRTNDQTQKTILTSDKDVLVHLIQFKHD